MPILLQTCCYAFTLRQGTILVAVIELLVSAIGLFLLLLGSAHAQEIAAMLEADIAENRGVRPYHPHSEDASVDALPPFYYSNNEIRLHKGQYLALVMIMALYIAIAIVTVHLISCMLLLYGSIMHVRQCLMPWMSVVVLKVVVVLSSFFFFVLLGRGTAAILLVTVLFVLLRLYLNQVSLAHFDLLAACYLLGFLFNPEDGGSMFL
ncbi:hypothetical protein B7P43_G06950 [Cryptotermes secundus]|uniref:Uncharacterized protein n=1 Tax=Cryptotermes secundus TaxID=105785 RepID=A0A2J7QN29_9NEOP|nr:hypothetical protein B7P43_G06950 [Cryptotermes secundus]